MINIRCVALRADHRRGGLITGRQTRSRAAARDGGGQRRALNLLHRVELKAVLFTNREDRHDVGVMQPCRRFRFSLKSLPLPFGSRNGRMQHLQRNAALERLLLGFIDDAHAAATNLTHDAKIAQQTRPPTHRPDYDRPPEDRSNWAAQRAGRQELALGPKWIRREPKAMPVRQWLCDWRRVVAS